MARTTFTELPQAVREKLTDLAGEFVEFTPAALGNHADVAGLLRTSQGRAFIKGARLVPEQRGGGAEAWSLLNEARVLPFAAPYAPELLWSFDAADWRIVGFECVDGRQAVYAPGSPDLDLVGAAIEDLSRMECPPEVRLRVVDRYTTLDERASVLAGHSLVHCDLNSDNVLIDSDGAVRIVDWAFASSGAPWLDYGFMVPWMIRAGHSPEAAEAWLSQFPLWKSADPWHVDLFTSLLNGPGCGAVSRTRPRG